MSNVDQRLASLEARMDTITEIKTAITDLREEMTRGFAVGREEITRGFADLRGDMNRGFEQVDRRIGRLEEREDRHFLWLLGIQMTVLITVVAALFATR